AAARAKAASKTKATFSGTSIVAARSLALRRARAAERAAQAAQAGRGVQDALNIMKASREAEYTDDEFARVGAAPDPAKVLADIERERKSSEAYLEYAKRSAAETLEEYANYTLYLDKGSFASKATEYRAESLADSVKASLQSDDSRTLL